jgi:hypothetical protein
MRLPRAILTDEHIDTFRKGHIRPLKAGEIFQL